MDLMLHIGMQKAGSKAFQALILQNRAVLERSGLIVPETGLRNGWHQKLFTSNDTSILSTLHMETNGVPAILMSYEAGYIAPNSIIDGLASIGSLKPLIFLRHPVSWTNSYLNQMIKAHRVSWKQIINWGVMAPDVTNYLNIPDHIARWVQRCDNESDCFVVPYHREIDMPSIFLQWTGHLMKHIELPSDPNPAADVRSLGILLCVKKSLASAPTETLVKAIKLAHNHLRKDWGNTHNVTAPMLLSLNERKLVNETYEKKFLQIMEKFGCGNSLQVGMIMETTPIDRRELMNLRASDRDLVLQIVDKALE